MLFCFLITADTHTGRFQKHLLPQQDAMELFAQDTPIAQIFADKGLYDASSWFGVLCNQNDEIVCVRWIDLEDWLHGTLDLQWLPESCEELHVQRCNVAVKNIALLHANLKRFSFEGPGNGTAFALSDFPPNLEDLIFRSKCAGSVKFASMPKRMLFFTASGNMLSGTINLPDLREPIGTVNLAHNQLEGSICLVGLPETLKVLVLNENNFTGCINLTALPFNLVELSLNRNKLVGSILLDNAPQSLKFLNLWNNAFVGEAKFLSIPAILESVLLFGNKITAVTGADGEEIHDARFTLSFHGINFQQRPPWACD